MYKFKKGQEDSVISLPGSHTQITKDTIFLPHIQAKIARTDFLRDMFELETQKPEGELDQNAEVGGDEDNAVDDTKSDDQTKSNKGQGKVKK